MSLGSSHFFQPTLGQSSKPNIIHVFIDDADSTILNDEMVRDHFPNINRLFIENGVTFDNYSSSTPLCGPVRASLFRGQLGHNTGIRTNFYVEEHGLVSSEDQVNGSWQLYHDYGYVDDDIWVWMKDAGYKTMLVGKYHHENFPRAAADWSAYIAPGWDEFYVSMWGKYYETRRLINGQLEILDPYPNQYRTDVEKEDILNLLDSHSGQNSNDPFYLYFAPFAPHAAQVGLNDPMYAARHANEFNNFTIARDPRFNEWNVSDKANSIKNMAQFVNGRDSFYQDRLRSMLAVDEAIWEIYEKLEDMWEEDNTYIFFSSDNGLLLGHHRVPWSKKFPYKLSTTMPMYVFWPGINGWEKKSNLTSNIDLGPTFVDIGNGTSKDYWDGQSLLPVLNNTLTDSNSYRTAQLVENWEWVWQIDVNYKSVKFETASYNVWKDGSKEYFDHRYDPYETESIYNVLSQVQKDYLDEVYNKLETCAGSNCVYKDTKFLDIMGEHAEDKPTSSISFIPHYNHTEWPWERYILQDWWETIEWNAFDQDGIELVEVVIWKLTKNGPWDFSREYFNYETQQFQEDRVRFNTNIFEKNEDSSHVRWKFEMPILETLENNQLYWLIIRAKDVNGNWEDTPPKLVLISSLVWPVTSLTSPISYIKSWEGASPLNQNLTFGVVWNPLRWRASNWNGVKIVSIVVREVESGNFWNQDSNIWQTSPISDQAVLSNQNSQFTNWSYTFDRDLVFGEWKQYLLLFRHIDNENNIGDNYSFRFTIED
jgi:arylsulfatase A-like enzyme